MDQITHDVRRQHWLSSVNAFQTRTENSTVKNGLNPIRTRIHDIGIATQCGTV